MYRNNSRQGLYRKQLNIENNDRRQCMYTMKTSQGSDTIKDCFPMT